MPGSGRKGLYVQLSLNDEQGQGWASLCYHLVARWPHDNCQNSHVATSELGSMDIGRAGEIQQGRGKRRDEKKQTQPVTSNQYTEMLTDLVFGD